MSILYFTEQMGIRHAKMNGLKMCLPDKLMFSNTAKYIILNYIFYIAAKRTTS